MCVTPEQRTPLALTLLTLTPLTLTPLTSAGCGERAPRARHTLSPRLASAATAETVRFFLYTTLAF